MSPDAKHKIGILSWRLTRLLTRAGSSWLYLFFAMPVVCQPAPTNLDVSGPFPRFISTQIEAILTLSSQLPT